MPDLSGVAIIWVAIIIFWIFSASKKAKRKPPPRQAHYPARTQPTAQPAPPAQVPQSYQQPPTYQPVQSYQPHRPDTEPSEPTPEVIARATELEQKGRTIEAIEVLRENTGMELYEASQFVRKLGK